MGNEDIVGEWVGPMPVRDFIETFIGLPTGITIESMPNFKDDFLASLPQENNENIMHDSFITAITASNVLGLRFKLIKTAYSSNHNAQVRMQHKRAISLYKEDSNLGSHLTTLEEVPFIFESKTYSDPADPDDDDDTQMNRGLRPLSFETEITSEDANGSREMRRGWMEKYAGALCARQHRTHCFILWLRDPDARIIRFDRSGAVFSAKINYRYQSRLLLTFLWRFSQATEEVRGHDTTVSEASPEESWAAKAGLEEWKPASDRQVLKMGIPDAKKGTRFIYVWKPVAESLSVTGRATRGYPGWDPLGNDGKGAVVFVKDSWRSCEDGMEKESAILQDLNDHHCRNVPVLICGDDIPGQSTVTKSFVNEPWNLRGRADDIVARVHTRFAQDFVGYHLETFKTSRQLIQAIYDALIAHKDAYEKCSILHCDISAGNILLKKGDGGILNDWDLAKRINHDPIARQPSHRSGTWQFMSAALLFQPGKPNDVQDDMESIFWLLLYHVLRYMNHSQLGAVKHIIESIFDQEHQTMPNAPVCGGRGKKAVFLSRDHINYGFVVEGNKPLTYLVTVLLDDLSDWYVSMAAHSKLVHRIALAEDITHEEAAGIHPFDPRQPAMYDYTAMIKAFKAALDMERWPDNDAARDRLPRKNSRKLNAIFEGEESQNSKANMAVTANPVAKLPKRPKGSNRLSDESFGSREVRRVRKPQNYTEEYFNGEGEEKLIGGISTSLME